MTTTTTTTTTVSFNKSWAQQTEESYQLQLALALRLSSQAALANDPNILDFESNHNNFNNNEIVKPFSSSPEALSYRFWVNGCMSYSDRIPDGFYMIHGVDPYTWSISTNQRETGYLPSIESLRAIDLSTDSSVEVVLIDRFRDPDLKQLQNKVIRLSHSWINSEDVVGQLANIVCTHMGGVFSNEDEAFGKHWKDCSEDLKKRLGSVVLPMGNLSTGLCIHRALLFKVLADSIDLPCRIAKGCKYCRRNVASSCIVRVDNGRECLVDLFWEPGVLSKLDSSINCTSSILVSSPLSHPGFKATDTAENFRALAKRYFLDCQLLNLVFDDASSGSATIQGDKSSLSKDKNLVSTSNNNHEASLLSSCQRVAQNTAHKKDLNVNSNQLFSGPIPLRHIPPSGHRDVHPVAVFPSPQQNATNNLSLEVNESLISRSSVARHLHDEDLEILWSELKLKDTIGAGSFGTVHLADWRGSDVAVKILVEQNFLAEHFQEFLHEVTIMKRLRHPNIVLFMGVVIQPPHLSIVTEYLSRGSLHKLLHKPDAGLVLDINQRLNMAYDVANGMNYLHQLRPPIVHRDLKSPNLLVDRSYTVKVCDFGLSRSKANTYLSSKTGAGTPEWMAPEVLRNDPSNEKSDVYSFGVILWELVTLQQPWRNLNQAQVVAEVGFKGRRLEIPSTVNPSVATLIDACLANEPSLRPSFSYIMETLQKLIKSSTS